MRCYIVFNIVCIVYTCSTLSQFEIIASQGNVVTILRYTEILKYNFATNGLPSLQ